MSNGEIKIPRIYLEMEKKGCFDLGTYLFMNEIEWMSIESIRNYEYEPDESRLIIPFAVTGGGDKWVWIRLEQDEDFPVGLCESCEDVGIYYAKNTQDAIMRQIIEYISSSNFYIDADEAKTYQISESKLKEYLHRWINVFETLFPSEYIDLLKRFEMLSLKKVSSKFGEWYALLSNEEEKELIKEYLNFDDMDEEFEHYIV